MVRISGAISLSNRRSGCRREAHTFTDPDDFEAAMREARFDLVLTEPGEFKAHLTCVELRNLHLL